MKITLPWPARQLSPNARLHWAKRNMHRKSARDYAALTAKIALCGKKLQFTSAFVAIEFSPPDRRRRDIDNMLSSLKPALDGVAEAIGIDDSKWSISIKRADDFAGEVRLHIEGFA